MRVNTVKSSLSVGQRKHSAKMFTLVAATVNWQLSHIGSGDSDNAGHVPGRTLFLNIFFTILAHVIMC